MKKDQKSITKPPLSHEELELKISKLETVISALNNFLLTSQPQEDEIKKIYSSLEVLLQGTALDVDNAGHSHDCDFIERIMDGVETIQSASFSKTGHKLID